MKKLLLLLILISLFSCEKEESIPCENKFIEMYNIQSGGVARYLVPYDCSLTEQQNFNNCYDCSLPEIGCRVVIRP